MDGSKKAFYISVITLIISLLYKLLCYFSFTDIFLSVVIKYAFM